MLTGEETLIPLAESIQELAPDSWSESELIFQPRTLMYGVYKLIFHSRMWDVNDADPLFTRALPFAKVIWFHSLTFSCWYYYFELHYAFQLIRLYLWFFVRIPTRILKLFHLPWVWVWQREPPISSPEEKDSKSISLHIYIHTIQTFLMTRYIS